jgi:HPt (histidine-containing phosphotransfer) domain-containing protein
MKSSVFDMKVWDDWKKFEKDEDSPGFLLQLLQDAHSSSHQHITALETAVKAGDLDKAFYYSHTLGSTCLSLGAVNLGNMLRELEHATKEKPPRLRSELLPQILAAFKEFMSEIEKECARQKSAA